MFIRNINTNHIVTIFVRNLYVQRIYGAYKLYVHIQQTLISRAAAQSIAAGARARVNQIHHNPFSISRGQVQVSHFKFRRAKHRTAWCDAERRQRAFLLYRYIHQYIFNKNTHELYESHHQQPIIIFYTRIRVAMMIVKCPLFAADMVRFSLQPNQYHASIIITIIV